MHPNHCTAKHAANQLFVKVLLPIVFLVSSTCNLVIAQASPKPVYLSVLYVKVSPGMGATYHEMLNTYTRKVNENHLKAGRIIGWYTHDVLFPSGSSAAYDMTIVTVSNNLGFLIDDTVGYGSWLRQVLHNVNEQTLVSIMNSFAAARTIVKREIYSFIDGINTSTIPSKYVQVDYMKTAPNKGAEYVKTEREMFKPVHADFVKQGKKDDWGLYSLDMPYSETSNYDYFTANFFSTTTQMTSGNYAETFKKLFPKLDMNVIWNNMNGLRKMYRSELWKLGVYVDQTNTK